MYVSFELYFFKCNKVMLIIYTHHVSVNLHLITVEYFKYTSVSHHSFVNTNAYVLLLEIIFSHS